MKASATILAFSTLLLACPVAPTSCTGSFAGFVGMPPVLQSSFEVCVYCCDNGACSPGLTVDGASEDITCGGGFMCNATVSGLNAGEHALEFFSSGESSASKTVRVVGTPPRPVPDLSLAAIAAVAIVFSRWRRG